MSSKTSRIDSLLSPDGDDGSTRNRLSMDELLATEQKNEERSLETDLSRKKTTRTRIRSNVHSACPSFIPSSLDAEARAHQALRPHCLETVVASFAARACSCHPLLPNRCVHEETARQDSVSRPRQRIQPSGSDTDVKVASRDEGAQVDKFPPQDAAKIKQKERLVLATAVDVDVAWASTSSLSPTSCTTT
ncbi:hypothetical protein PsorP6_012106 [Peronosclerospora sorghi]|uniref:Uncharacterized protein n=1 Tax=Peronosclerospora sorghi TaxID=230839 RepID=A0ACC0WKR1_9STRA|nr:hypothetical protein PsorP6_012106 [Peronosclerospora sorghi]